MSKSYKKNPYTSITCATSEKWDKRVANKKLRLKQKQALRNGNILPVIKEVSNTYYFAKDGKLYYDKNSEWYKHCIRK